MPSQLRFTGSICPVVLLLGVALSVVGATSALAQDIGEGQGLRLRSDLIQQTTVQPGERLENQVLIENTSDRARTVSIERRDLTYSFDGSRSFPSPGSVERSNSDWISLSSNLTTVPPGTTLAVGYEIQVPGRSPERRDSLRGSYWSTLIVEPTQTSRQSQGRIQINASVRYSVQIITHIEETGTKSVNLLSTNVRAEGEDRRLIADLKHTGTRSFQPDVYLELYDGGSLVGKYPAEPRLLHPSTSVRYKIPVDGIEAGSYAGVLVIDGGEEALYGAQLDLEL